MDLGGGEENFSLRGGWIELDMIWWRAVAPSLCVMHVLMRVHWREEE